MWANKRYNAFTGWVASQGIEKIVKRLTFTILFVGIFTMLSVVFLVGYGVHRINQAIPLKPDPDLTALEQLLTRKLIILTREQKEKLAPIVRDLTQDNNVPEKVKNLKEKMWDVLDSNQVKSIKDWRDKASAQAGDLVKNGGPALKGTVEKYKEDMKRMLIDQYKFINTKWFNGHAKEGNKLLKLLE